MEFSCYCTTVQSYSEVVCSLYEKVFDSRAKIKKQ